VDNPPVVMLPAEPIVDNRPGAVIPAGLLVDNPPGVMIFSGAVMISKDLCPIWRRILRDHGRPPLIPTSARAIMDQ